MAVCRVDTFCCGCTLRTGAFIIGWVDLILGVLKTFWNTYQIANDCHICWGFATINFLSVPLGGCLLIGTLKERKSFLWTWVCAWWLLIPIAAILYILILVDTMYNYYNYNIVVDILLFIEIYYNVVVRSYAISIKEREDGT
ncbi:hypothetical protein SK128_007559 [Halocaridina rubra]|uniref:Uncharacterized protein n=1 Tax=Halocaridina rubra TaxID=373956 RepID=A0AAN8XKN7_HALRR